MITAAAAIVISASERVEPSRAAYLCLVSPDDLVSGSKSPLSTVRSPDTAAAAAAAAMPTRGESAQRMLHTQSEPKRKGKANTML